jgi:hypothetical protein
MVDPSLAPRVSGQTDSIIAICRNGVKAPASPTGSSTRPMIAMARASTSGAECYPHFASHPWSETTCLRPHERASEIATTLLGLCGALVRSAMYCVASRAGSMSSSSTIEYRRHIEAVSGPVIGIPTSGPIPERRRLRAADRQLRLT